MMILPGPKDAIHKAWMYRVLAAICDQAELAAILRFKGGTCAAMRGLSDRFSIDLDFDYTGAEKDLTVARKELETVFRRLGLAIKDKSALVPQYFLKYPAPAESGRNTLKIDITFPPPAANRYETVRLGEIDRVIDCQTVETMFANKLVAFFERYEKHGSIAGRDLYDIHHFFMNGYGYEPAVIIERRGGGDVQGFFRRLLGFIDEKITDTIIDQDINMLLERGQFSRIRKILKTETMIFLRDEIGRLENQRNNTPKRS